MWLPVTIGPAALSWLAHQAAVTVSLSYGELVRTAFDTRRGPLLAAFGLAVPTSFEAERELWKALAQKLYRGDADRPELLRFGAST